MYHKLITTINISNISFIMTLFPIQNGTAIIPQGTTIIEDRAFFGCKELTTVIIPEGVTTIGESAFRECTALTHVVFPSTITHIGDLAFFETPWDKNLPCDENDLPKELYIGTALYKAAYDIDVIEVKEGTTCICSSAFCCHTTLTKVVLPDSVKYIGGVAFAQCPNLKSLTLPKNLEGIGFSCFMHTGLDSITIPEGVKTIEKRAFYGCESLTSIVIPNSVEIIERCVFSNCSSLASIIVETGNTTYDSRNNCNAIIETATNILIAGCQNTIIPNSVTIIGSKAFNGTSITALSIPNSVTTIRDHAFYFCSALTSITLPESLTSIEIPNSVTSIGESAFTYCQNLVTIIVDENNSVYDSRENCNAIIETSTNTLIVGCKNTTIPSSVTSIGNAAFYGCTSLTNITIPNSVTSIGEDAFRRCTSLTSIEIPDSVTSIGDSAFYQCYVLTDFTLPAGLKSLGKDVFYGCRSLTSIVIPDSVESIGEYAFSGCSSLIDVTIPHALNIDNTLFSDSPACIKRRENPQDKITKNLKHGVF